MAHLTKLTRSEVGGIGVHVERQTDNHANKDIDVSKTHLNYSLLEGDLNMHQRLAQRLDQVHVLNRKDVNVACSWIVTLPNTLLSDLESGRRLFFEETHNFLQKRYGGSKNVIMSEVHRDETTEHLHFVFIPIVYDKKRDREKVSAKEVIDRSELKAFHTDLDTYLRETIPHVYLNGILNNKTVGVETVKELKLYDKEIKQQLEAIKSLNVAVDAKEDVLKTLKDVLDTEEYPTYVERKKTLVTRKQVVELPKEKWEEHFVHSKDYESMQKRVDYANERIAVYENTDFYKTFLNYQEEIRNLRDQLEQETKRNTQLEKDNASYTHSLKILEDLQDIFREKVKQNYDKLMNFAKRLNNVSSQLSDFLQGVLAATVTDNNLLDTIEIAKDCWNHDFEIVADEYDLPINEIELEKHNEIQHGNYHGISL